MIRYSTTLLLLVISVIWIYGQDSMPVYQDATPCDGYWKSYKHPYMMVADSLWDQGEFERATNQYKTAATEFRKEHNWKAYIKASNRVSVHYSSVLQYDTAFAILAQNLDIITEYLNSDALELAENYHLFGVWYDHNREVNKSLDALDQMLEIKRNIFGENHIEVARGYLALGELHLWTSKQFINAEKYLSKAANIIMHQGCENSLDVGNTYFSLASTYRSLGDYRKAKIYGLKALSVFERIKGNSVGNRSRCYNLLGNINYDARDFQESNRNNTAAIQLLLNQENLTNPERRHLANCMNSLARTYAETNNYDSAFHYLSKSLRTYQSMAGNNDKIALAYQNIGIHHTELEYFDSAYYYLSKANEIGKHLFGQKHFTTSSSLRHMGNLFRHMNESDSALSYYQQAIVAGSGKNFKSYNPLNNPGPESLTYDGSLLEALFEKASMLRTTYPLEKDAGILELSLESVLIAIEIMDRNQELYDLERSTLLMTSGYYGVFEVALDVCFSLYELTNDNRYLETAFFAMEKSKARLLFDSFSRLQKNELVGLPDSLVVVEKSIKSQLASLTQELENEQLKDSVDKGKVRHLEEQIFQSTVNLEHFNDALTLAYPSYVNAVKSEIKDLTMVQNRITLDESILIDYFWGDSILYTIVVKEDGVEFSRQSIAPVKRLLIKYQEHLRTGPQFKDQSERFTEFWETAYLLYQLLFKAVGVPEDKPLIIAADGLLRFIPFEALVVNKPDLNSTNYDELRYALYSYPISYVYSANLWAIQQKYEPGKLTALGFSHDADNKMTQNQSNELPGTAMELELLRNRLKGLYFSGIEATKQRFIDNAQQYDIIHLAIHGISDSTSHLNNRLLFRNPAIQDQMDPLYTHELYDLRLSSRLAVLSACESGVGMNFQGEGVYSMSRAFAYAGCPTTVMSLWRISDKTTPEILEQFYRHIFRGLKVDQALRQAKLSYLKENSRNMTHPGLWASMVVHGNTDSIVKSNPKAILFIILALIILTIIAYQYKRMRVRNS